ncbi:hypothetical protein B0H13DRAFT_1983363, partial [Mycena leptocephala]
STTPTHDRVIDDTDPAIQYGSNGWFVADPSTVGVGNFGPIYQNTSHATTSRNSTLTFPFNGTAIRVLGTISISTDSNNVTDPTWDCFIDDIQISNPNPTFPFTESNWLLCEQPQVASGLHELRIEVQSKGKAFYLDRLIYTPPPDAAFEAAVLVYPYTDPVLSYGSGWDGSSGQMVTNTQDSQVALNFHGTSVSLYGTVSPLPFNPSWGVYTIDDGPPTNFTLKGLSSTKSPTNYNILLFSTPAIPSGPHEIVVKYGGDSDHTPLVVGSFLVSNTTSSSPSSSFPPPSSSNVPIPHSKTTPVGIIAGAVIGSLALLAMLTTLAFCYRRRRRRAGRERISTDPYIIALANGHQALPVPSQKEHSYGDSLATTSIHSNLMREKRHGGSLAPTQTTSVHPERCGLRLPSGARQEIVELPPNYSPN